jgi:hypothetical protein
LVVNCLADVVASAANENGATTLLAPDTLERTELNVRVYSSFILAGLVPPLSAFVVAILADYGLLLDAGGVPAPLQGIRGDSPQCGVVPPLLLHMFGEW